MRGLLGAEGAEGEEELMVLILYCRWFYFNNEVAILALFIELSVAMVLFDMMTKASDLQANPIFAEGQYSSGC